MELLETRFASSGDVSIACQVLGDARFDLNRVPPFMPLVALARQIHEIA